MPFLPGWDSSEFVRTAHRDLEFTSIIGFVVCAGCELVKHLKPLREKLFERLVIGSFLFAAFMELVAFPYGERNDELARAQADKQDFAISELSTKAKDALGKAKKASDDSDLAVSKSADALGKSQSAEAVSRSAMSLARNTRKEADSFEKDITSAKKQAADAESHLADALLKAASAEKEAAIVRGQIVDREITAEQRDTIPGAIKDQTALLAVDKPAKRAVDRSSIGGILGP